MIRLFVVLVALFCHPGVVYGATAPDLRTRIIIDGNPTDFDDDEWVVDASTAFRESPGDSRWGLDNDVERIAVTWDNYNVYGIFDNLLYKIVWGIMILSIILAIVLPIIPFIEIKKSK